MPGRIAARRFAAGLSVVVALTGALQGCGSTGSADKAEARRTAGGPLKPVGGEFNTDPMDIGQWLSAGSVVLGNHGSQPAVVEDISLINATGIVEIKGIYAAGPDRRSEVLAADDRGFPPPWLDAAALRAPKGVEVPPLQSRRGRLGVEIIVVARLPRAGKGGWDGVTVDYRVGGKPYRTQYMVGYLLCAPMTAKCEEPPGFEPSG